jgi:glutamate dehydrogenase
VTVADWVQALVDHLAGGGGGPEAADPAAWAAALPAGYRECTTAEQAAADWTEIRALAAARDHGAAARVPAAGGSSPGAGPLPVAGIGAYRLAVRSDQRGDGSTFRLRRYGDKAVELTSFLPVVQSFGLTVMEAVPHRLPDPAGAVVFVDDLGLRAEPPGPLDPAADGPRLVAAMEAAFSGEAEVDSLNRLVVAAGTDWRQVGLLRAYRRYRRQAGTPHTDQVLDDALVGYPAVARALLSYFSARFDPAGDGPDGASASAARRLVVDSLAEVASFEQDQILRGYLAMVDATVRTSWFRPGRATLALKFDSRRVPGLPAPRPEAETFVYSPAVEGIHLRAGRVARGGIRWSDRGGDFRTEVLDLTGAQVKKNAIIVPTGAKGGFVCRGDTPPAQVRAAYTLFIRGLLDITDNISGDGVVPPRHVVRADGDDPYLVVAADKGTATFSDLANSLSEAAGYWLGDAFASGGSRGYDHKAMGITARGAWKAVERHFRHLGIDVATDPVRVAGVGDMSGDVFGNGMLLSRAIRLVAAFDHRHVFLDPDPDPEASYAERRRLASLPRSSWDDYDRRAISAGGGVWRRDTKRVELSPGAQAALGVDQDALGPLELISAILASPVDLLWFGGIGTFVKAPNEADSDVADHANDAVRVTTNQIRTRVIAEGGNLGITQRARIRYSRRGGRINTDFIDNAAGVATSDREVNLKILLGLAIDSGRMDGDGRDRLLASVAEDVAAQVLDQIDHGVAALDRAVPDSANELDAYVALMEELEQRGGMDRAVEALPDADEIAVRRQAGAGLIRPELAVLLAYTKSDLMAEIVKSPLVDDPSVESLVADYFPEPVRHAAGDLIPRHRLYRELAATGLAGVMVDEMGMIWGHETAAELARPVADVAAAWWAAWKLLGAQEAFATLQRHASALTSDEEAAVHATLRRAVGALARAYLTIASDVAPSERIAADSKVVAAITPAAADCARWEPDKLGAAASEWAARAQVADVATVQRATGRSVADVTAALAAVDSAGGVGEVGRLVADLRPQGRWARWEVRALHDDLDAYRRRAAAAALAGAPGEAPERAVGRWLAGRQAPLMAARRTRLAATTGAPEELAAAALAVRFLTGGVRSGVPPENV